MFQGLIFITVFLTGLTVGSFLNSVIYRLHAGESFLFTPLEISTKTKKPGGFFRKFLMGFQRSYCPHCKKNLKWQDLIPLLSFLILRGRCSSCRQKISRQYPLVEFFTGVVFILIFGHWDLGFACPVGKLFSFGDWSLVIGVWDLVFYLIIACFLIIIFVYDLKHYIIPDKIIYPAIFVCGIWYFVYSIFLNVYTKYDILNTIYAAFGAAGFFLAIVLVSRGRWMGFGDVKLAFFMGLFLGFPDILVALFLAFFLGSLIGGGLVISGKKTLKSEVPFGPFLVTGTFIAFFWGRNLINWYLNLFL